MKHLFVSVLFVFAWGAQAAGGIYEKPAAFGSAGYGALAFNVETRAWAHVVRSSGRESVTDRVARLCGSGCAVYGPIEQCGAIFTNGVVVGYGAGPDKAAAESEARRNCGSANCEIAVWVCNQAALVEGAGFGADTNHARNYGAIAYDGNTGAFGTVWDYASFSAAAGAARGDCGSGCRIYAAQSGDCGVLARGGASIAVGSGTDYASAEKMALDKCGLETCKPLTWFCNSGSR